MKARKSDLLKIIVNLDEDGTNLSKKELFEKFKKIKQIENLYLQLLMSGEIFEIKEIVFPITTKNDREIYN